MGKGVARFICLAMAILMLSAAFLTGCAQKAPTGNETAAGTEQAAAGEQNAPETKAQNLKGEVTMWAWADMWNKVFAEFNKVYPDIKVNYVPVDGNDYFKKLTTAISAGSDLPDIGWLEMNWRGKLISMDIWENLEAAPYSLNRGDMLDFLVPLASNEKGQIVGIECGPAPAGMAYRRDLATQYFGTDDQAELEKMFSSWDEFIGKGIEVKEKSGGKVFMMSGLADAFQAMRDQKPNALVDGSKIKVKDAYLDTLKNVQKMRDAGIIDKLDQWSPAWNASYASGNYIFYPCALWSPAFVIKPNDKDGSGRWGLMMPPGGAYNWGGTLFGIPKDAKNKDLAWAVINWCLYSKDGAKAVRDQIGYISAFKPVYDDPEFYGAKDDFFGGIALLKGFADLASKVTPRPLTKYDNVLKESIDLGIKGMVTGASAEESIQFMEEEIIRKAPELSAN